MSDRGCFRFVDSLEQVAAAIGRLVTDDPERAATLYETFLAGCYEKADEFDDSSGSFGMFAQSRFEAADQATPASVGSDQAARQRRAEALRWADALRSLYAARGDLNAYVDLANCTGLTTDDCLTVANLLVTRGDRAQALSWMERGLELDAHRPYPSFAAHSLTELKPRLLADLGHGEQALETAWAGYRKHPDRYSYDHLMTFVPHTERPAWHNTEPSPRPRQRPLPARGDRTAAAHR